MMPSMDFDKSMSKASPQSRERAEPRNPTVYDWLVSNSLIQHVFPMPISAAFACLLSFNSHPSKSSFRSCD